MDDGVADKFTVLDIVNNEELEITGLSYNLDTTEGTNTFTFGVLTSGENLLLV